ETVDRAGAGEHALDAVGADDIEKALGLDREARGAARVPLIGRDVREVLRRDLGVLGAELVAPTAVGRKRVHRLDGESERLHAQRVVRRAYGDRWRWRQELAIAIARDDPEH